MRLLFVFFILASIPFSGFGERRTIAGFVFNTETEIGLDGVHVFWLGAQNFGTITNQDGNFLIQTHPYSDTLVVSHVGFTTAFYPVKKHEAELMIGISPKIYELSEVTVEAISADAIMRNVIASLSANHPPHPVYYSFFHREVFFSRDSIIHLMEEHTGIIEHRQATPIFFINNVRIDKSRIGYFTDEGRQRFEYHRFIPFTQILWDNPLFDRFDHLHPRRSRHFEYSFAGMETIMDRECFIIDFDFKTARRTTYFPRGRLYIDAKTFAIVKEILKSRTGSLIKQVNYIESSGQWFLRSVVFQKSNRHRTTVYNFIKDAAFENGFTPVGVLLPQFVKERVTDFSDEYWEGFQSVPLPDWIKSRIEGSNYLK